MIFEIRAVDEEAYRTKCEGLKTLLAASGPDVDERVETLLSECRQQLESKEFCARHETSLAFISLAIRPELDSIRDRRLGWETRLFTLCLKLLAMPGFQTTPLAAPTKSDTYVFIGDYDSGLHRFLFGTEVFEALEARLNAEGLELSDGWMVILNEEERAQIETLIDALLGASESAGDRWRVHAAELGSLLQRARSGEFALCISYNPERSL